MSIVFLNDTFVDENEAVIPITDRGFLFGDGVFTTMKVSFGTIINLEQHLHRIYEHCRELGIVPPVIQKEYLYKLIEKNQAHEGVWRLKVIVTGGQTPALSLSRREYGTLLVTLKPFQQSNEIIKLTVYSEPINRPAARVKSLSYLDRLQIKQYAIERRCDDCLTVSSDGYLLEASTANVYWIEGKTLYTPSRELPLLFGITLQEVIKKKRAEGMVIKEGYYTLDSLPDNVNFYLCNAMTEECSARII